MMGSGAEAAEEAVDALNRQGEKVGLLKVRLYRPFDAKAFLAALPATVKSIAVLDRDQGAGRDGRAAVPGHRDGAGGECSHAAICRDAGGDWRALRLVVEGIYAGDGEGHLRRADQGDAEEPLHDRHRRRCDAHQLELRSDVLDRRSEDGARAVLRAGLGRHGGREQEFDQDYRQRDAELRAGLFCVRLEEVGVDDDFAPALRAESDSLDLSDYARQLCGLPQLQLP